MIHLFFSLVLLQWQSLPEIVREQEPGEPAACSQEPPLVSVLWSDWVKQIANELEQEMVAGAFYGSEGEVVRWSLEAVEPADKQGLRLILQISPSFRPP